MSAAEVHKLQGSLFLVQDLLNAGSHFSRLILESAVFIVCPRRNI